jgi:hypothetical protein
VARGLPPLDPSGVTEDEEDLRASSAALDEYATAGGVDADAFFQRLVAEDRVTYETD